MNKRMYILSSLMFYFERLNNSFQHHFSYNKPVSLHAILQITYTKKKMLTLSEGQICIKCYIDYFEIRCSSS